MDEHRLQTRPFDLHIVDGSPDLADPVQERRQLNGDVTHPRPKDARVGWIGFDGPDAANDLRRSRLPGSRVELQRYQSIASDGFVHELSERAGGNHAAVIDNHSPRAPRLSLFEVMRRQQ